MLGETGLINPRPGLTESRTVARNKADKSKTAVRNSDMSH